jgi:subtilase family serine protease
MYLAHGVRAVAVALGVATVAVATAAVATTETAPRTAAPTVTITPGIEHQQREPRTRPSTTAECEQAIGIACYDPVQIQHAYNLRTLYSRGITGKGATIVVIDPYGSPTIGRDLRTFDRVEGVPNPPSLRIIRPAGKVPAFNANNANMVG